MITVINYGAGNLRSVINAITSRGFQAKITSDPQDVLAATAVILPGVGAAGDTMANLQRLKLDDVIRRVIADNRHFLGICIGLQVLFSGTEEGGWYQCLDVIPGQVRRLPAGQKIPHMGWNQVKQRAFHPLFEGIPDNTDFYFVHSYYADPADKELVIGETDYGITFCSAIARGNLVAVQFHPEKSGTNGMRIYDNFFKMAGISAKPV
jgi:imidazole glycerol-phosphate synthase subunit HisH